MASTAANVIPRYTKLKAKLPEPSPLTVSTTLVPNSVDKKLRRNPVYQGKLPSIYPKKNLVVANVQSPSLAPNALVVKKLADNSAASDTPASYKSSATVSSHKTTKTVASTRINDDENNNSDSQNDSDNQNDSDVSSCSDAESNDSSSSSDAGQMCRIKRAVLFAAQNKIRFLESQLELYKRLDSLYKADTLKAQGLDLCAYDLDMNVANVPFAPALRGDLDCPGDDRGIYVTSSASDVSTDSEGDFASSSNDDVSVEEDCASTKSPVECKKQKKTTRLRKKARNALGKKLYTFEGLGTTASRNHSQVNAAVRSELQALETSYAAFAETTMKTWGVPKPASSALKRTGESVSPTKAARNDFDAHSLVSVGARVGVTPSILPVLQDANELKQQDQTIQQTKSSDTQAKLELPHMLVVSISLNMNAAAAYASAACHDEESLQSKKSVEQKAEDNGAKPCSGNASDQEDSLSEDARTYCEEDTPPQEWNMFALSQTYILFRRIFEGEDVVAYEGITRSDKKHVVIKVCDNNTKGKIPREVRLLHRAQGHANICTLHAWHVFTKTNSYALVTDFVQNKGIPDDAFVHDHLVQKKYMSGLLHGIQHLHKRGILYRDVKPSNVLWSDVEMCAKIIDFDIATLYQKDHLHRSIVGTDGYMAPEVLLIKLAKRNRLPLPHLGYGERVDVYGAGIVLGQLLFHCLEKEVMDDDNLECKGHGFLRKTALLAAEGQCTRAHWLLVRMLHPLPTKRAGIDEILNDEWFVEENATT
jgi:tRNA A-37 threonylcarbamoyl transferase component Bud32